MNRITPYRIIQEKIRHLTHILLVFGGGGGVFVRGLPSLYITLLNEAPGETSVDIACRNRLMGAVGV